MTGKTKKLFHWLLLPSLLLTLIIGVFTFTAFPTAQAESDCDLECNAEEMEADDYNRCVLKKNKCLQGKIGEYQSQIDKLQNEAQTLTGAINLINGQMALQQLQVRQTQTEIYYLEKEIEELGERIEGLSLSLDSLTSMLIRRVQASYKQYRTSPLVALFTTDHFSSFISQYKYLQQAEKQTAKAMEEAENQRLLYDEQKTLKQVKQEALEEKRQQLEFQQQELERQKQSKEELLAETKNSEANFQRLLAQAQAELEAIEAITAGKGIETKIKDVKEGEKIASVITGASCNSSGTHLHFIIKKEDTNQNPFSYLKSIDHTNSSNDPFNPSGSWSWPLKAPIILTQGYGYTWAIQNTWVGRIYSFHNGIDIVSKASNSVYATHDGELSYGKYDTGCSLNYVKVENKDKDIETLYLHVNY